jgi:hypothetical protein
MTLLERRLEQRRKMLEQLYDDIDLVRRCDREGYADLNTRILSAANTMRDVEQLTVRIADLEDVRKYGPDGGR